MVGSAPEGQAVSQVGGRLTARRQPVKRPVRLLKIRRRRQLGVVVLDHVQRLARRLVLDLERRGSIPLLWQPQIAGYELRKHGCCNVDGYPKRNAG